MPFKQTKQFRVTFSSSCLSVGNSHDCRVAVTIIWVISVCVRVCVQESSGGLWDSVKKAAFIIGSGILFLAAFGNSLTW